MGSRRSVVGDAGSKRATVVAILVLLGGFVGYGFAGTVGATPSASGDLTPIGCVGTIGQGPAACTTSANLANSHGVVVSPDGHDVYATSPALHDVEVLSRGSDGTLTPAGCVGDANVGPANCTGVKGLRGATGVAVSPDGKNVYVAAELSNTLQIFTRSANGVIASEGCIGSFTSNPAGCPAIANLSGVVAVAVSPDGHTVYAASANGNDVEVFNRAQDGSLTAAGCVGDPSKGPSNCTPTKGLIAPAALVASPDGKNLYVLGYYAIVTLSRSADGSVHPQSCIESVTSGLGACALKAHVDGGYGVAISPDGTTVYAAGLEAAAVEVFARGADGSLTPSGCVGVPANCTPVKLGAADVKVSADGKAVYVAASGGGIDEFSRAADGSISYVGCVVGVSSAATPCDQAPGADLAVRLAVSPDSKNVYVAAEIPGSIAEFATSTPMPSTTISPTTTSTTPVVAHLVRATVTRDSVGTRILQVAVSLAYSETVRVRVFPPRGAAIVDETYQLRAGAHGLVFRIPSWRPGGDYRVDVSATFRAGVTTDLATTVLIPG